MQRQRHLETWVGFVRWTREVKDRAGGNYEGYYVEFLLGD